MIKVHDDNFKVVFLLPKAAAAASIIYLDVLVEWSQGSGRRSYCCLITDGKSDLVSLTN